MVWVTDVRRSGSESAARWARWLVAAGIVGLMMSWSLTTPPLGYPDEGGHYVRALAVGSGEFYGSPNPQVLQPGFHRDSEKTCCDPGSDLSLRWVALGARVVAIPSALTPDHLPCAVGDGVPPAPCGTKTEDTGSTAVVTALGTIEPVPYVLPGLAANLGQDAPGALRFGRLMNVLVCGALLGMALFSLDLDRNGLGVVGLLLAVTPMVAFIGGSIAPSALEVSSAIGVFSLLLRACSDAPVRRWHWIALAGSSAALCASRSLGPVWLVLEVAIVVALVGVQGLKARVRASRFIAATVAAIAVCASVFTVWWEFTHQPGISFDARFFLTRLRAEWTDLPRVGREVVGVFGSLDIEMNPVVYIAWAAAVLYVVALAFVVATRRERVALGMVLVLTVVAAEVIAAAALNQNGFGLQGRHVLAFAATVPLTAGAILARHDEAVGGLARRRATAVCSVVAVVHGAAMVTAGKRYGWLDLEGGSIAAPPGGRVLWIVVTTAALAMLVLGAMRLVAHQEDRPRAVPQI